MSAVLVIAEHENGALKAATYATITAATKLGGDVDVVVTGGDIAAVCAAATSVPGVRTVFLASNPAFAHQLPEAVTPTLVKLAAGYDAVLVGASTYGKNLLPRLAAKLDVQPVSDVTVIHGPRSFDHPVYAGNAIATLEIPAGQVLLSIRPTAFAVAAQTGGSANVKDAEVVSPGAQTRFIGLEASVSERPELSSAGVVVSGGRGLGSAENFKIIEALADKLNAAIGASRAAVDAGYVPNDYQVGQTGKVVAPQLYIAVGISGAIQHLAGMKDSKVIVAINKDPEAPIFQIADYGLVGDLFQLVPELTAKI